VDALANVSALTLSVVQELSRFLYTFRFYAPFFHARNVHGRVEHLALGLSLERRHLPLTSPFHANNGRKSTAV
jgi:hypothetical protein